MEKLADLVISALTGIQDNWIYWPLTKNELQELNRFFFFFCFGSFHFSNRDSCWIYTWAVHVYEFPLCIFYPWSWGENADLSFKNCTTSAQFPCMPTCMWSMAEDILEHPVSQVRQYDALWKSLCQGRKVEGRWEGCSCFTKSTNCSQTQKRLSTAWLQKEFNIPFSRVNDADQRSCIWKDKLSLLSPSLLDLKEKVWKITVLQELPTLFSVGKMLFFFFCQSSFLISKY